MNGNNYFLDTNAIIALLNGNKNLLPILNNATQIGISVISIIEFLSFPKLSSGDKSLLNIFIKRVEIKDLVHNNNDIDFLNSIAVFKIKYKLKLPDAIIACHAMQNQSTLITNDSDFKDIDNLSILSF